MKTTKRYDVLEKKNINLDVIAETWPEVGLETTASAFDPVPSIRISDNRIVEMDGKKREDFDSLDYFIADYGIDTSIAETAMSIPSEKYARMLVDINVSREEILKLSVGLTPAKLSEIVAQLNIVEIMMTQMKMRARKRPATQAHATNLRDNPVLMAADAAEAALRGFAEIETTCIVARYAPFNAIALLVGSQAGRPGVLTQCAMEEALELQLGMQGLTSYAETISVYGTEGVFTDGDDTPWSKAFLASAYASRGLKMRSTSGCGSEVLMGDAESKSLLYLETRCIWVTKAAGMQGTQNGSIDGIGISSALPGGLKMVALENLIASMLGLEVASGNDAWFTNSDMRKAAKFLTQMLPGTDFIASGFGAIPNKDNSFAGSNSDCDDYDDYYMIQRDMMVDGGLVPADQVEIINVRRKAAKAMQAVFAELGFAEITDEEVEAAVYAYCCDDMPVRNSQNDIRSAAVVLDKKITGMDIAAALDKHGFTDVASAIVKLTSQRVAGDYLHTSAIFDENFRVLSEINNKNDYTGPGTGYRLGGERWNKIKANARVAEASEFIAQAGALNDKYILNIEEIGTATQGQVKDEVVVVVSPSFGKSQKRTVSSVEHATILQEIAAGLEEEGIKARFVKCYETADLGAMASIGSKMSGSGISIGVQSKGTTVIHQKDMSPLLNLELFSQAPHYTAATFRAIGKSAGKYAKGELPVPIEALIDPEIRRFLLQSAILHCDDKQQIISQKPPVEFVFSVEDKTA